MKLWPLITLGMFAALLPLGYAAESTKGDQLQPDVTFFNGKDLTGWSASEMKYWSVKDGAIVGHSAVNVPGNKFIWANGEVADFYLVVDVKLTPDNCNAGIQFRSRKANASGQAVGYQADVGAGVWGKLYHEHGRGKLDWNNNAAGAVKPGDWNRYEILAVGHKIWTAINGKLCVALEDPKGELSGKISFQIHGGPAQTVLYRNPKLTHNPKCSAKHHCGSETVGTHPHGAVWLSQTDQSPDREIVDLRSLISRRLNHRVEPQRSIAGQPDALRDLKLRSEPPTWTNRSHLAPRWSASQTKPRPRGRSRSPVA